MKEVHSSTKLVTYAELQICLKQLRKEISDDIIGAFGRYFGSLDQELAEHSKKFEQIDARFEQIDARFEQIDARFEQIDARFEQIDARFEQIDARFDRLESRFDRIDNFAEILFQRSKDHEEAISIWISEHRTLQKRVETLEETHAE